MSLKTLSYLTSSAEKLRIVVKPSHISLADGTQELSFSTTNNILNDKSKKLFCT